MKQFLLSEIQTRDGIIHQGMYFCPKKPGKKAIMWIHGLTSNFYSSGRRIEEIVSLCDEKGIGFASFNNRGHDMLASAHLVDTESKSGYSYITVGSGTEHFNDSVLDIDAAISFLVSKGFTEIFLVGSSTGANKAAYYVSTVKHSEYVKGIILLSPLSDRLSSRVPLYKRMYLYLLRLMGFGEYIIHAGSYFPGTANRFLSLITPKSEEDIFDYGDPEPSMIQFSKISLPLLILFGKEDSLADRDITEIQKQFDSHQQSIRYSSKLIDGANHGFDTKEKELAKYVVQWINGV